MRRPKILVLDESTADLDQDSANELLRVIDENFTDTTVISIAHRLNFIRNSDKILVLNTGGTINVRKHTREQSGHRSIGLAPSTCRPGLFPKKGQKHSIECKQAAHTLNVATWVIFAC